MQEDCKNRNSCSTCVENKGCVWCSIKKSCTVGNSHGPEDNNCPLSFNHDKCDINPCDFSKNCQDCLKLATCGWCGALDKCVEGDNFKPKHLYCTFNYFHKENKKNLKC